MLNKLQEYLTRQQVEQSAIIVTLILIVINRIIDWKLDVK